MTWLRRPGEGRYARRGRERRFMLTELPPGLTNPRTIEDHYLTGTRLRLRRVTDSAKEVYRLGQKVRPDEADPSVVSLTNIYLSAEEYAQLRLLPAYELHKTRWVWRHGGLIFALDEFTGPLAGLVLAEIELAEAIAAVPAGPPIVTEVTHDDRYSGGSLAVRAAGTAPLAELLPGARS